MSQLHGDPVQKMSEIKTMTLERPETVAVLKKVHLEPSLAPAPPRTLFGVFSRLVQSVALIAAGLFLLSQVSSTPHLALQVTVAGGLMTVGGAVLAIDLVSKGSW